MWMNCPPPRGWLTLLQTQHPEKLWVNPCLETNLYKQASRFLDKIIVSIVKAFNAHLRQTWLENWLYCNLYKFGAHHLLLAYWIESHTLCCQKRNICQSDLGSKYLSFKIPDICRRGDNSWASFPHQRKWSDWNWKRFMGSFLMKFLGRLKSGARFWCL